MRETCFPICSRNWMLTHWNKLINTDCVVIEKNGEHIYPIFKNGSTSLLTEADRLLTNSEISTCRDIKILIREPASRFVSGLNQYCEFHGLDVLETHDKVKNGTLSDRHFAPQWIWLMHLMRYYKGTVTLESFDNLNKYCSVHHKKRKSNIEAVEPLQEYTQQDMVLIKHIGQNLNIEKLVRICKDGLPKT